MCARACVLACGRTCVRACGRASHRLVCLRCHARARPDKRILISEGRIHMCTSSRTVSENSTYYDDLAYFAVNQFNKYYVCL